MSVTFPLTAPGALLPLDAPLPQPRRYTLLDAAVEVTTADDRWMAGAWINAYPAGEVQTVDPCASGTYRLKDVTAGAARPMAGSFTVVLGGSCTGSVIGSNADWYKTRLAAAFQARESAGVERALATGDGHSGSLGQYLGDPNMENLGSATPVKALRLLEDAIAEVGNGMIHATPGTITFWERDYLLDKDTDGKLHTKGNGTLVVNGAGYLNARPDGHPGLGADEAWAFASGFVQYRRDDLTIMPSNYSQALDRSINEVTFYAERDYLLTWVGREDPSDTDHVQAGVLVSLV